MNTHKKIVGGLLIIVVVGIFAFGLPEHAYADSLKEGESMKLEKENKKNSIKEQKVEKSESLIKAIKNLIKEKIKKQIKGDLTAVNGSTLSVKNNQTIFSISTSSETEIKQKYGGSASLVDLTIGDQLVIIGNRKKNTDGTLSPSEIDASYIRDLSIQKKPIVISGEVVGVASNSITVKTNSKGIYTVYGQIGSPTVGDRLIVKGETDSKESLIINAKSIIKLRAPNRLKK